MNKMLMIIITGLLFFLVSCDAMPGHDGVIMELKPDGSVAWKSHKFPAPSSFSKGKDGRILVTNMNPGIFYSMDDKQNIKWEYEGNNPWSMSETEDETYLLSSFSAESSYQEVTVNKDILWSSPPNSQGTKAIKLKNGNYLLVYTKENFIKELDKNNTVVWQTQEGLLGHPYDVQILDDDKLLIADYDMHRVIEIDKNSKILWELHEGLNHPSSAVKLEDGTYVVSDLDNHRVIFVNKDKEILKEIKNIDAKTVRLHPNGNIGVAGTKAK